MIPLLCHPQSRTAHSTHSLSVSPLGFSLEHVHIDVFDRCVSRCLCGQGREVAAVSEGSAGFLSFQVQEGATVLAYRSHLSAKKKKVCCSKPDKERPKFPAFYFPGIHLSFQLLLSSSCDSRSLYYFSFLWNFDSCRSGHPCRARQTDTEKGFDTMMARVIVLFQSFGERELPCACV